RLGIIDQDIEAAEQLDRPGDRRLGVGADPGGAGDPGGIAAGRPELGDRRFQLVGSAAGDPDPGAIAREDRGDALGDALAAAGDDRDLAAEPAHLRRLPIYSLMNSRKARWKLDTLFSWTGLVRDPVKPRERMPRCTSVMFWKSCSRIRPQPS